MAYAIDTHAAVKRFEQAGFNAQQAEVVAEVINGAASEQVTKQDFVQLRQEFAQLQSAFDQQAGKIAQHGSEITQLQEDVAQLKVDVAQLRRAFDEFKVHCDEKFATKEDLARESNKVVIAMFAGLGLLFAALQVYQ